MTAQFAATNGRFDANRRSAFGGGLAHWAVSCRTIYCAGLNNFGHFKVHAVHARVNARPKRSRGHGRSKRARRRSRFPK